MAPALDWVEVPFRPLKEQAGMRLDAFLAGRLRRYSRAAVQRLIEDGRVLRAGRPVKPASRVEEGEVVLIRYPRTEEPPLEHETLPVLHQDERLVVVSKPSGVLSHPTDKIHLNTVTWILTRQLGRKVHLCHRLDRETTGVMALALDPAAARGLYEQFLARRISKEYLAVVSGEVAWEETVVDAPIAAEGGEIKVRRSVGAEGGQSAVTAFRRLRAAGGLSLVSAVPRTGRLHQIRAHLAHLGHPLLGDKLYRDGGAAYMKAVRRELAAEDLEALGAGRQLLHAWRLRLAHPGDGRPLSFEAPVPADFPLRPEAA